MYLDYFGFDEPPFSITPDPKFVFLSQKHEESLAHLVYGISRGGGAGFVQLTGEVGTGKTTISRLLLEQIPNKTNVALILNPTVTPLELIQNICKELKVNMRGIKTKLNALIDKLNSYLIESWSNGENTVVIIDEAQNLGRDTLEQLRLLTNLETNKHKLLQIILIGQPELRSTMRRNDLRQLAQRVTARYHLMPLSIEETYSYITHRIAIAGGDKNIVSQSVAKVVYKTTNGVPRLINILLDRAFLAAYSDDKKRVNAKHIKIAATEVMPETDSKKSHLSWKFFTSLLALLALIPLGVYLPKQLKGNINTSFKPDTTKKIIEEPFRPATIQDAWQQYFSLWDAENTKNWHKAQCPNSVDTGMACLRRQGNLNQISKLNHPVLLQLESNNLVLLSSIGDNELQLLAANQQFEKVNKDWLEQHWFGVYFILWPMPAQLLTDASSEQIQKWSLEMANTIAIEEISITQLDSWIKDFQETHHLPANGIIGTETQMLLSLSAYNGPTLN